MQETQTGDEGSVLGSGKTPWRNKWQPTPELLPGEYQGRKSLVGCNPWGREESDTTKRLPFHFSLSCIGEGNGNPLQCSCLENPRDRGSLVGCRLWGRTESDTTEATQQQQHLICTVIEHSLVLVLKKVQADCQISSKFW